MFGGLRNIFRVIISAQIGTGKGLNTRFKMRGFLRYDTGINVMRSGSCTLTYEAALFVRFVINFDPSAPTVGLAFSGITAISLTGTGVRIGGSVFSVIRPFAPVVSEMINVFGLGLIASCAGVGHGSAFGAGGRTVLNAFVPSVGFRFALAAFGILTSARVGIGYHVVHPIAEVAGVCLINHGESKIIMQNAMQNPADIIVNAVEIPPRFIFVNTLFHRIFHDIFVKVGVEIDLKIAFVFACLKFTEIRL